MQTHENGLFLDLSPRLRKYCRIMAMMFKARSGPQRYFDGWARAYDRDLARYDYAVPQMVYDALKNRISGRLPLRLLDMGIGTGLSSSLFRAHFPDMHITGVDASQNMLDLCRGKGVADRLFCCDVRRDTLPPGPYQAIIAAGLMEFIEHPQDVLDHVIRHLAPGGYAALAFETPATAHLYGPRGFSGIIGRAPNALTVRRIHTRFPWPHIYSKYLHSTQYVVQLSEQAGMEVVEAIRFDAYRRGNGDVVTHDLLVVRK